jgi:hypothetical protein
MPVKHGSKGGDGRMMNSRIAVREATARRVREFAKGLDVTQDEAINFVLDRVMGPTDDPLIIGRQLRPDDAGQEEKAG